MKVRRESMWIPRCFIVGEGVIVVVDGGVDVVLVMVTERELSEEGFSWLRCGEKWIKADF
jgi:hypothetical protein